MRILLEFKEYYDNKIILPTGFNRYIQALIYKNLPNEKAKWLHNKGFEYEKRSFKLFVFSSILEKPRYNRDKQELIFPNKISFYISSPVFWILEELANNMLKKSDVFLGRNRLRPLSIGVVKLKKAEHNSVVIKTITPIEVHSTFQTADGKKKTYYYSPLEREFSSLIKRNIQKKWQSFYKKDIQGYLSIRAILKKNEIFQKRERIIYFGVGKQRTVIKGWIGDYEITAKPDLINFAMDTGLGSRGSQGMGMCEIK